MVSGIDLKGWVEVDGRRLTAEELEALLSRDQAALSTLGGEFFLRWNGCVARDRLGVFRGDCPPGSVVCEGEKKGRVDPSYPTMELGQAIVTAVKLRSDEGVVALSGGVDSALVAGLAERECLAVGLEGSHDLRRSREVAEELDLPLEKVVIPKKAVEGALQEVLQVIPRVTPVDASIATTLYFVAEMAGQRGYERILAGQGADELFGGYARYLETDTLAEDLERDFLGLPLQAQRDQAVAAIHGTYFSLPYLDLRVVTQARAIPAEEMVKDGIRKRPLREAARRYIPPHLADYEKKAMQYGSGIWKEIDRLARRNGYKRSVQEYLYTLQLSE